MTSTIKATRRPRSKKPAAAAAPKPLPKRASASRKAAPTRARKAASPNRHTTAASRSKPSSCSKVAVGAPYPRNLEAWLKKDETTLKAAVSAGLDLFTVSDQLSREPFTVIDQLNALGLFEFEAQSEEHLAICSLALSGVPLLETIRWCSGDAKRLPWAALDALRTRADYETAISVAWTHGFWRLTVADLSDLAWIAVQPPAAVADGLLTLREALEGLTASALRWHLSAGTAASPQWVAMAARDGAIAASANHVSSSRRGKISYGGTRSKSRYPKGRRTKSPWVSAGAPPNDTRTTAQKAWELLDHW